MGEKLTSDVDPLDDLDRVIDLDAHVLPSSRLKQ